MSNQAPRPSLAPSPAPSRATAPPRRWAAPLRAGVVALTLLGVVGACNGESEGQPCDRNAANLGDSDCNSPLLCLPSPNPAINDYRCCPSDPRMATTFECSAVTAAFDSGTLSPPLDSSTADTGAAETGGETDAGDGGGADGPVESGGEAGAAEGGGAEGGGADASEAGQSGEAGEGGDAAGPADATLE